MQQNRRHRAWDAGGGILTPRSRFNYIDFYRTSWVHVSLRNMKSLKTYLYV